MATTTTFCSSYKNELLSSLHNMAVGGNAFKFALVKVGPTGTYGAATTNYSNLTANADEVTGAGYTAAGAAMSNSGTSLVGTTGIADFGNLSWAGATFSTTAGIMYNTTNGGRAVACWDFGGTQTVSASTFTITMPVSGATTSLIRCQ